MGPGIARPPPATSWVASRILAHDRAQRGTTNNRLLPGVLAAGGFALTVRPLLAMLRPDMETAKLAQAAADAVDTHELAPADLRYVIMALVARRAGGREGVSGHWRAAVPFANLPTRSS